MEVAGALPGLAQKRINSQQVKSARRNLVSGQMSKKATNY
jgi:hypothetical protein